MVENQLQQEFFVLLCCHLNRDETGFQEFSGFGNDLCFE